MIPKILHYCWFGRGELPFGVRKCIESWKKVCPDYRIVCWNEENFSLDISRYAAEAYHAGKYAFVSDVARLVALHTMGGIYLDTDVELRRSPDFLLQYPAVGGFEEGDYLQTAFLASEPNGEWIQSALEGYNERRFFLPDGSQDITTNVSVITEMTVEKYGLMRCNREQDLGLVHIFPREFFSPKSFRTGILHKTANTVCIHHFESTWTGKQSHSAQLHRYKIYRLFGNRLGRKVLSFEEVTRLAGTSAAIRRIFMKRIPEKNGKRILLYEYAGSHHHGCEAVVHTIPMVLRDFQITFLSAQPKADRAYQVPGEPIAQGKDRRSGFLPQWFAAKRREWLRHDPAVCGRIDDTRVSLRKAISNNSAVFAIGGGPSCHTQYFIDCDLQEAGVKYGIIGCSFEPEDREGEPGKRIMNFGLITTSESISYEAVKKTGHPNVYLIPDTAFILPAIELPLPEKWQPANTIGLDFCPLCLEHTEDQQSMKASVRSFIRYLLENTNAALAFLSPEKSEEGEFMRELARGLNPERMVFLSDEKLNCMQSKGYISRCSVLISTQTQAVIAAYSSCVPALAIGNSVEVRGIARDLFGSEERYVFPIERICSAEALISAFEAIYQNEDEIHRKLAENIPAYKEKTGDLRDVINEFVR